MSRLELHAESLMDEDWDRNPKRPGLHALTAVVVALREEQGELFPPGTPLGPQQELPL